jgi:beta propeller repeat protein
MNETQITTNISDQYSPAIDENMIVWYDWRNGNPDVYMCTISGGEQETESENEAKSENEQNTGMRIPGFEMIYGVACLFALFLCKRK